jgi:hypothetical protein
VSSIVFAGAARDCAGHLPAVFANLERLAAVCERAAFVFVENDSADGTGELLRRFAAEHGGVTLFDLAGLGQLPVRALRLEFARNAYLEYVRTEASLVGFDYLCVMDMDDMGAYPLEVARFRAALVFLERTDRCAGVFANQQGPYYDLWALRHPDYCPDDAWYEVMLWARQHNCSDEEAFAQTFARRIRCFDPGSAAVEVDSAFGGLGVYRLDCVRRNANPYLGSRVRVLRDGARLAAFRMQQCEHVHFHAGLRQLGLRLFILPDLINAVTAAGVSFPPSAYRRLCF